MNILAPAMTYEKEDEVIEVKLWETYLLYHPGKLYQLFAQFSLDNGPFECENHSGKIVFRFRITDWENRIQPLFHEYRIPAIKRLNNYLRQEHQPVLR